MKLADAVKIIDDRLHQHMHCEVAEKWALALADLGVIRLEAAGEPLPPRCEPPEEHAGKRWHWIDVPGPEGTRRTGCFEWVEGSWWPLGRQVTPEVAAAGSWAYIVPAEMPEYFSPYGVHEGQAATADASQESARPRCAPPNLPLGRGSHLLRKGDAIIGAVWTGKTEQWIIPPATMQWTPEDAHEAGFVYLAAEPERAA